MSEDQDDAMAFARTLVYHPSIFNFADDVYTSKCVKNKGIAFGKVDIRCAGNNLDDYNGVCALVRQSPEFFVGLIFKLLERNIFVILQNTLCISEVASTRPVHCDLVGCNPKKHEIYVIVFCSRRSQAKACYEHARLFLSHIANMCPPGSKLIPLILRMYDFSAKGTMRLCRQCK